MYFESALATADRAFLAEVRAFIDDELDADLIVAEDAQRTFVADHARGNRWADKLRKRAWHAAHWPSAFGGAGLSRLQNYLLLHETGLRGAPHLPPLGLNYVGPTVLAFGTEAQKATVLPGILSGEDHWCQGFSEPGAGSDLAGVATFAARRGDVYVVNGSKIWTTDAQHANKIFCLVRTRRDASREALSFMLIDMSAPGITVRPIRMLTGDHEFNQVFFDDVEVAPSQLLGAEGEGWAVTRYLLEIERGSFVFGGRLRRRLQKAFERARALDCQLPRFWDAVARVDLDLMAYECTELRLAHADVPGSTAPAAANLIKIEWTELLQRIDQLGLMLPAADSLYAEAGVPGATFHRPGELGMPGWMACYFNNRAASVYGGSNEIQRNLFYRTLR